MLALIASTERGLKGKLFPVDLLHHCRLQLAPADMLIFQELKITIIHPMTKLSAVRSKLRRNCLHESNEKWTRTWYFSYLLSFSAPYPRVVVDILCLRTNHQLPPPSRMDANIRVSVNVFSVQSVTLSAHFHPPL